MVPRPTNQVHSVGGLGFLLSNVIEMIAITALYINVMLFIEKIVIVISPKKTIDGVGTTKPYDYYCVCVGYVHGTATFAVQTTPVSRTATAINYGKYLGRYREYTSAQQIYKLMSS